VAILIQEVQSVCLEELVPAIVSPFLDLLLYVYAYDVETREL
jgi:hypothetical protein